MFVIAVYDIQTTRVAKVRKVMRKYLHAVQKSVFEGHLTARQLTALKQELQTLVVPEEDSVLIYKHTPESKMVRERLGKISDSFFIL